MSKFVIVTLHQGREGSLLRRHPWIFSGAVKKVEGTPEEGQTVDVFTSDRKWLAKGSYSSKSQIRVRVLTFDPDTEVDERLIDQKVETALNFRKSLPALEESNACRLIFGESDGLPGVIVDRYDEFLVCQFLSAGAEYWKDSIIASLSAHWPCSGIYERSDTDSRLKEGLETRTGILAGEAPPDLIEIYEGKAKYLVNIRQGHKTGFYLDQKLNRAMIMKYCEGKELLNAFSYTGGFGIAAARAGARSVLNIDTSADCLDLASRTFALNQIKAGAFENITGDVFQLFRTFRDSRKEFDMIILDPPKFVASASQLAGGTRGYKDINLLAFKLLRPGGILVTFSCSGYVKPDLFQKIVADAAVDAGRHAVILDYLVQAPDHPAVLNYPEALYLKGLICRVS